MALLPLDTWPAAAAAAVRGVLTDIDDTLTREGAIEPEALDALQRLRAAGIPVVAITGRPVGWSEPFARQWPVLAIVAENGSVRLSAQGHLLQKAYLRDAITRQQQFLHLQQVLAAIEAAVPGAVRAQDSAGRETDIAVDHSEFVHLPPERVRQVVALMQRHGLKATVSSIHINGWLGDHNKWSGACWALQALLGVDLTEERGDWVYVGDSTNDQVMFEQMPLSVGVANIRRFEPLLEHLPRYITPAERGQGFAQVANALLAARAR
jgi:HAD superfamily hydrolase (TIGR01484 family)